MLSCAESGTVSGRVPWRCSGHPGIWFLFATPQGREPLGPAWEACSVTWPHEGLDQNSSNSGPVGTGRGAQTCVLSTSSSVFPVRGPLPPTTDPAAVGDSNLVVAWCLETAQMCFQEPCLWSRADRGSDPGYCPQTPNSASVSFLCIFNKDAPSFLRSMK